MASERKKPISEFGFVVKMELLKRNKNQNWLIDEVKRKNPSMFVDSSVLYKVLTGQTKSGNIVETIKKRAREKPYHVYEFNELGNRHSATVSFEMAYHDWLKLENSAAFREMVDYLRKIQTTGGE